MLIQSKQGKSDLSLLKADITEKEHCLDKINISVLQVCENSEVASTDEINILSVDVVVHMFNLSTREEEAVGSS